MQPYQFQTDGCKCVESCASRTRPRRSHLIVVMVHEEWYGRKEFKSSVMKASVWKFEARGASEEGKSRKRASARSSDTWRLGIMRSLMTEVAQGKPRHMFYFHAYHVHVAEARNECFPELRIKN